MMAIYLNTLPSFLGYFAGSLALSAAFLALYSWITPYHEMTLIRAGNRAAAISLTGAGLGFVIPLVSTIANSLNFVDMVVWGIVAMIVQLALYAAARFALPQLADDIGHDRVSVAIALSGLSLGVGLLNAACMTF
jgi:putative membrane protein